MPRQVVNPAQNPRSGLVLRFGLVVLVGDGGDSASGPAVADEQDPTARGDERSSGDQQAEGEEERRLAIHELDRLPESRMWA